MHPLETSDVSGDEAPFADVVDDEDDIVIFTEEDVKQLSMLPKEAVPRWTLFHKRYLWRIHGVLWLLLGIYFILPVFVTVEPPRFPICTSQDCDPTVPLRYDDCSFNYSYIFRHLSVVTEFSIPHSACAPNPLENVYWTMSALYAGAIVGSAVTGLLSDCFGRQFFLLVNSFTMAVGAATMGLAPGVEVFGIGSFLTGSGATGAAMTSMILFSETTDRVHRQFIIGAQSAFFALGVILTSAVVSLLPSWRVQTLGLSLPAFFLPFVLPCSNVFVESPRWLVATGRHARALTMLKRIVACEGGDLDSSISEKNVDIFVALLDSDPEDPTLEMDSEAQLHAISSRDKRRRQDRAYMACCVWPLHLWTVSLAGIWFASSYAYGGLALESRVLSEAMILHNRPDASLPSLQIGEGRALQQIPFGAAKPFRPELPPPAAFMPPLSPTLSMRDRFPGEPLPPLDDFEAPGAPSVDDVAADSFADGLERFEEFATDVADAEPDVAEPPAQISTESRSDVVESTIPNVPDVADLAIAGAGLSPHAAPDALSNVVTAGEDDDLSFGKELFNQVRHFRFDRDRLTRHWAAMVKGLSSREKLALMLDYARDFTPVEAIKAQFTSSHPLYTYFRSVRHAAVAEIASSTVEMLLVFLLVWLAGFSWVGRVRLIYGTLLLAAGFAGAGFLFRLPGERVPERWAIYAVQTSCQLGKILAGGSMALLYLYSLELFPTTIKHGVLSALFVTSKAAAFVIPLVTFSLELVHHSTPLLVVVGLVLAVAVLPTQGLPETLGRPMFDNIIQMQDAAKLNPTLAYGTPCCHGVCFKVFVEGCCCCRKGAGYEASRAPLTYGMYAAQKKIKAGVKALRKLGKPNRPPSSRDTSTQDRS